MSRVIYDDTIESIVLLAGTENPEYPIANLRNSHPRKPFRTIGNSCTLRIQESGAATAIGLVLTNATNVTVTPIISAVYDWGEDADGEILDAGEDADGEIIAWVDDTAIEDFVVTGENYDGQSGIIMGVFESVATFSRQIDVEITAINDNYVSIGLIVGGQSLSFRDFEHDSYSGTSDDKGTEVELNDGSTWYKPLRVLRKPSGNIVMWANPASGDPDGYASFYEFMSKVWLTQGKTPLLWKLSELGLESPMYASIAEHPVYAMHGSNHKIVAISLKERI